MALILLAGAALLAVIGGFLQARESVFFFYLALPFALGGVAAHVVAAVWPMRDRPDRRWRRLWLGTSVARPVLGLVVGLLGFGFGVAYGVNHQVWYGERVAAEITDTRLVCGQNDPRCSTRYRLAADGDDLGWTGLCGTGGRIGKRVDVDVDPLGWVPPLSPACIDQRDSAMVIARLWLGGLGAIALVIVVSLLWRLVRWVARGGPEAL